MAYLDQLLQRLSAAAETASDPAVELPRPPAAAGGKNRAAGDTAAQEAAEPSAGYGTQTRRDHTAALLTRLEQALTASALTAASAAHPTETGSARPAGEAAREALSGRGAAAGLWPEDAGAVWPAAGGAPAPGLSVGDVSRYFQRDARRYGG